MDSIVPPSAKLIFRVHLERPRDAGSFFLVRPAWAHSWRCKSSRKLITASEVKRNCMRATECGKEAWSVNCEPMDKNRIEGAAEQGERARNRKALVIKAKWRKSGEVYSSFPRVSPDDLAEIRKQKKQMFT
ncbi:hypothetical protein [Rhodoferax ferrireducens]|uniref:hypothetical protein n=1 Tax=Rhodoferax ferrireducens TaxID=192843 RepID=UPI003BB5ACCD